MVAKIPFLFGEKWIVKPKLPLINRIVKEQLRSIVRLTRRSFTILPNTKTVIWRRLILFNKFNKNILGIILTTVLLIWIAVCFKAIAVSDTHQEPTFSVEDRINDLLSRMTLEEKAGQMIQTERHLATPEDVKTYFLSSIFNGGGNVPYPNTPTAWCEMIDAYQRAALETRLQIPIIYGSDAVHGHNNVSGATIFPHNIGLGATRDAELVERIGQIVAHEVRATGVHWTFAPCIAVPQNEKWGRTYEGFSEDTALVSELGAAFVKGVQGPDYPRDLSRNDKIAACLKHYIADGATEGGVDGGNAILTEADLRSKYLPPYSAGINAGARTVMVSFNRINGVECHANGRLITDILKNELGVVKFGLVPKLVILENVNKWIPSGNTIFSSYLLAG